uniref:NADH-ubiquinone oxidoreductase chain 2 n=1 Tax=Stigmella roborella TaxID=1498834 RepID=A0A076EBQ6_9NEOP|nr:NADH dehydrogenase subunit 2 [Stigmella roborella]
MNSNKLFFLMILFFSTLIAISANSWLGCWIGLEINLLSFIPLISNSNNLMSSEAALKYFITQAIASSNLLMLILMNFLFFNFMFTNKILMIMINSSLLMKMGAAPFHFWFPNILEGLSWMNCFILMTWQKITPMILLSYYYCNNFLFLIIFLTSMIGAIGGLNQKSLRKLMAFSSINHMGWMIAALMMSENLWNFYFIIYSLLTMIMCYMFFMFNSFYLNQIFYINYKKSIKFFIFLNLLSLGGLPPFMGFLSKWIILNNLIDNKLIMISFILIMSSLITLYMYIRITYSALMFNHLKMKWFNIYINNKINFKMMFISTISMFGLLFSTLIFYI